MVVGDLSTTVEVVILGAGPGGYVAAIRAAAGLYPRQGPIKRGRSGLAAVTARGTGHHHRQDSS